MKTKHKIKIHQALGALDWVLELMEEIEDYNLKNKTLDLIDEFIEVAEELEDKLRRVA